jgi:peptidoglycan hydrolase CwlO-like protein
MIDLKLAVEIIESYEKFKALLPALKSEYESLKVSVDKTKLFLAKEQQNLNDLLSQKDTLLANLQKHKDEFLNEARILRDEAEKLKKDAEMFLNSAKIKNTEAVAKESDLNNKLAEADKLTQLFSGKLAALKDVLSKLL